ncbi:MAG: hypothetical protein OXI71_04170 [Gemmatimonadota bacterium]|nr:hypothetical protein [Gemmatimonadota bacterium]
MIEVDLLPGISAQGKRRVSSTPVPRKPFRFLAQDPWVQASSAVFLLSVTSSIWLLLAGRERIGELNAALESAVLDSARTTSLAAETRSVVARLDSLRTRVSVIRDLDARRYVWPRLLDEVAKALPPEAWLVQIAQLSADDGRIRFRVEGKTFGNVALSRFWDGMESSDFIHDVRLVSTEHLIEPSIYSGRDHNVYFFVLEADYRDSRPHLLDRHLLVSDTSPAVQR